MLVSCYLFIIQGSRLHHCCVCFHAIFMSPLWLNHPSLSWYLQMTLMGPRLHWSTQCSTLQRSFIIFCSAMKTLRQRAVQLRLLGPGGLYFHQEERTEAGWLRRGGGRITFSSGRGKKEADCFAWNNLQFAPQTIFSLKKKKTVNYWFFSVQMWLVMNSTTCSINSIQFKSKLVYLKLGWRNQFQVSLMSLVRIVAKVNVREP